MEDNSDISYYIGSELKDRYKLFYACNGKDGLERAEEVVPDLIITDVMMPEMDGYELCRRIRESLLLNHIPIIIITARSSEKDKIKGLEAGADAYLYKPFNSRELNVRVETLLESRRMLREKYATALSQGKEDEVKLSDNDQTFLNRVIETAYRLMDEGKVDNEHLSDRLALSSKQLGRKILTITGKSTSVYVTQIKLSRARFLLDKEKNMAIGEIALKCGFDDSAYFSRIFKKTFKQTPSEYRRRVK